MKRISSLILFFTALSGCGGQTESSLNIGALVAGTEAQFKTNKHLTIQGLVPVLEHSIEKLELVCSEVDASDLQDQCEEDISTLKYHLDAYRSGEWEKLPKGSLEDYSKMYFELMTTEKKS